MIQTLRITGHNIEFVPHECGEEDGAEVGEISIDYGQDAEFDVAIYKDDDYEDPLVPIDDQAEEPDTSETDTWTGFDGSGVEFSVIVQGDDGEEVWVHDGSIWIGGILGIPEDVDDVTLDEAIYVEVTFSE